MSFRNTTIALLASALITGCAASDSEITSEQTGSTSNHLIVANSTILWTTNANTVPMCWDQNIGFGSTSDINTFKAFVRSTIENGWERLTKTTVTWTDCPTTGTAQHVRTRFQVGLADTNGNPYYCGNTGGQGQVVLTTPAQRSSMNPAVPCADGGDAPGMRLWFPSNWNSAANIATSAGLVLHEFGHILGFAHESGRSDGTAADNVCYNQADISGQYLGPLDPNSIMGAGGDSRYCNTIWRFSPNDIDAMRSEYGVSNNQFAGPQAWSTTFCKTDEICRVADVDGDSFDDLVAFGHGSTNAPVWVGRSTGASFQGAALGSNYFCTANQNCELADVNGDGKADLIASGDGNVWVSLSQSTGSTTAFSGPATWSTAACYPGEVCKFADVNHDGKKDLIVFSHGATGNGVWVLLSSGAGFNIPQAWSSYFCTSTETCDVGDVNGDSQADIISFSSGNVWVSKSTGTGFASPVLVATNFCLVGESCAVRDVDGDLKADLVAFQHGSSGNGNVWVDRSSPANAYSTQGIYFAPPKLWHNAFCYSSEQCLLGRVAGSVANDIISLTGSPANTVWVGKSIATDYLLE